MLAQAWQWPVQAQRALRGERRKKINHQGAAHIGGLEQPEHRDLIIFRFPSCCVAERTAGCADPARGRGPGDALR